MAENIPQWRKFKVNKEQEFVISGYKGECVETAAGAGDDEMSVRESAQREEEPLRRGRDAEDMAKM